MREIEGIAHGVVNFIRKMIVSSPCYPGMCGFEAFFGRAIPLTGDLLDKQKNTECELIEAFAAIAPDDDEHLKSEGLSVFVTRPFLLTFSTGVL